MTKGSEPATTHLLERTSPTGKGSKFIGRCVLCDLTGLPISYALRACTNPRRVSRDDALLQAIDLAAPREQ